MPSATPSGWRELPRSAKSECPKLFFNFSKDVDKLSLKLTDLVAIWECSLNRASIYKSAREQHSSIDPSESTAQLQVLLDKLEQSLEGGRNLLFQSRDRASHDVCLKTTLDLPKPLKALSWNFDLESQDAGELSEQLLRPCLHTAFVTQQKCESLLRVIKDKDHVLSRLLEKIEASAIDLSLIFPGITSLKSRKGQITVKEAQKHVPGMGTFDADKWSINFGNESPYSGFDQIGIGKLVAGCERCPKHTLDQHSRWYTHLPVRGEEDDIAEPEICRSRKRTTPEAGSVQRSNSATESDFERQATPQHLKERTGSTNAAKRAIQNNDSTYSEDVEKHKSEKPKHGKVGGLRHRTRAIRDSSTASSDIKQTAKALDNKSPDQGRPRSKPAASDTETETETASDSDEGTTQSSTHSSKRKLGTLHPGTSKQSSPATKPDSATTQQSKHPSRYQSSSSPSPARSTSPSAKHQQPNNLQNQPSSTRNQAHSDTESDIDNSKSSPVHNKSQTTPNTRRKLGQLFKPSQVNPKPTTNKSDKGDETETETASEDSDLDSKPTSMDHHPQHNHRLGTISSIESKTDDVAVANDSRGETIRPESPDVKSGTGAARELKEETVEEKADRRREELKRRLNAGGGGPKRRKF